MELNLEDTVKCTGISKSLAATMLRTCVVALYLVGVGARHIDEGFWYIAISGLRVILSTAKESCNCEDCLDKKGWNRTLLTSNPSWLLKLRTCLMFIWLLWYCGAVRVAALAMASFATDSTLRITAWCLWCVRIFWWRCARQSDRCTLT